jgi:hypothetical protein
VFRPSEVMAFAQESWHRSQVQPRSASGRRCWERGAPMDSLSPDHSPSGYALLRRLPDPRMHTAEGRTIPLGRWGA